jgi:hypothetical protein
MKAGGGGPLTPLPPSPTRGEGGKRWKGELVGDGILRTLSLINNLEINEQILYAQMINVEQSTLIE